MLGRSYSSGTLYRYGFNGKEKDSEVKGEGAQYDYGFRIYDPRLGRFLSVDPLTKTYPWYTPYQFAGNNPIKFIDLDGLEQAEVKVLYGGTLAIPIANFKTIMKNLSFSFAGGASLSSPTIGTEFNASAQFKFTPSTFSFRKPTTLLPQTYIFRLGVSKDLNKPQSEETESPAAYSAKVTVTYNSGENKPQKEIGGEGEKGMDYGNPNLKKSFENVQGVDDITGTETLPLVPLKQNNVPANNNEQQPLPETTLKNIQTMLEKIQLPVQKKPGNTLPTSTPPPRKR